MIEELKYRIHIVYDTLVFEVAIENLVDLIEPVWEIKYYKERMLEDMKVNGQRVPILVEKDRRDIEGRLMGKFTGKWKVIHGQRRVWCCLQLGIKTVKCQQVLDGGKIQSDTDMPIYRIPIEYIMSTFPEKLRSEYRLAFIEDIRKNGVKDPIHIQWLPKYGKYRVLDGNHRYYAALRVGLKEIPCRVFDPETAEQVMKLMAEEKKKSGWTQKEEYDNPWK